MPHFNPGDRVRRIGHNFRGTVVGEIYTVELSAEFYIKLVGNYYTQYEPSNFELVEAAPVREEFVCYLAIFEHENGTRKVMSENTEEQLYHTIRAFTLVGWTLKAVKRIKTRI